MHDSSAFVMRILLFKFTAILLLSSFFGCKQDVMQHEMAVRTQNEIRQAKGFAIYRYDGFSVVKITNPWPNATKDYTYVLAKKGGRIPDSLRLYSVVTVPLKSVVVTSTTHIPSLEMLGQTHSIVGFPGLDLISSKEVRARIEAGKIRELGNNQSLNTELLIDLQPDLIVGFGIDNNNPTLDNLQKNGLTVMLNGDWNEQTPLGKAEWIKFFGALYGKEAQADSIFNNIETAYNSMLALARKPSQKPTVMAGAIYENQWFLPQGNSWSSIFIRDAQGQYLWADSSGTGSLSLSFEAVFEKAKNADFWIGPSQYTSLAEMRADNPHYAEFRAFQKQNVYSFSTKKGATGGLIFYELAPNRPDLVLQDMVRILHPELLPHHELFFFEKLK